MEMEVEVVVKAEAREAEVGLTPQVLGKEEDSGFPPYRYDTQVH